jgi:hypothetical protein
MKLFGNKKDYKMVRFELFFSDVQERSFEIKSNIKDKKGETISTSADDVIKLSSLRDIIEKHFGVSLKSSKTFTHENLVK